MDEDRLSKHGTTYRALLARYILQQVTQQNDDWKTLTAFADALDGDESLYLSPLEKTVIDIQWETRSLFVPRSRLTETVTYLFDEVGNEFPITITKTVRGYILLGSTQEGEIE